MPDLANLSISDSLTVTHCPNLKSLSATDPPDQSLVKPLRVDCDSDQRMGFATLQNGKVKNGAGTSNGKSLEDHVRVWVTNRKELGIPETRSSLPFLYGTKKLAECLVCHHFVYPGEGVLCSVRGCQGIYHGVCVKERPGNMKKFTCPQHACFICKQRFCRQRLRWQCVCCPIASHDKCTAWPDEVMHLIGQPRRAVCWRHLTDWRQERKDWCILLNKQHAVSASNIEEVFFRLPLPYTDEEFKIDLMWKHTENNTEPPPYTLIRRNLYLVKKKRDDVDDDVGCRGCTSTCTLDCVCRVQCISCSKACHCSENCTNRPFRKEKKIRIVKTAHCGWGAEAAESVKKGEFIIEYIGEVIDDALCEKRLWDMKYKEVKNFYMCEIRKDFTIDATFKGNSSRFLNHSCDPNCVLEKWQVEGETRVGVFAARSIEVGEPLTYDYRFVQFGPEVRCCCGAPNCQGYLGTKKKICKVDLSWGKKRKRTTACMAILG